MPGGLGWPPGTFLCPDHTPILPLNRLHTLVVYGIVKDVSTSAIDIVKLDPLDDDLVRAWIAMQTAATEHDIPGNPLPNPVVQRLRLQLKPKALDVERWIALLDGEVVGYLQLDLPLSDNRHLAEFELEVHPERRRRGFGGLLLEFAEQRARDHGRDTMLSYVVDSIEGLADFDPAGKAFAERHGYPTADVENHRRNDLSLVDDAELERLYTEAWRKAAGYELVEWTVHAPDDLVEGVAAMNARMWTDPPIGEMDLRPAVYDAERVRDEERVLAERGQLKIAATVRHVASGEVAGHTDIIVQAGEELHALQNDTIVDPKHRGKRLGTILKIANQRQLLRHRPMIRYVHTWNAEVNDHMISINEAIGYRMFLRELAVQKKLV